MNKKALIFGVTGQDGSYLAEFLLKKNILFMVLSEDHLQLILKELIIFFLIHFIKIKISFIFIGEMLQMVCQYPH